MSALYADFLVYQSSYNMQAKAPNVKKLESLLYYNDATMCTRKCLILEYKTFKKYLSYPSFICLVILCIILGVGLLPLSLWGMFYTQYFEIFAIIFQLGLMFSTLLLLSIMLLMAGYCYSD
jgi:hypothetical protein